MSARRRQGGCSCGALRYEMTGEFGPIWNCHCPFCRRIHGAAFTTVGLMARDAFRWTSTSEEPSTFETPMHSIRHFCGKCATPICNFPNEPSLLCLVVSSLDDDLDQSPWAHVNLENKAKWFQIEDDIPQYDEYPDLETLGKMSEEHSR